MLCEFKLINGEFDLKPFKDLESVHKDKITI